jgi:hypothetical protein
MRAALATPVLLIISSVPEKSSSLLHVIQGHFLMAFKIQWLLIAVLHFGVLGEVAFSSTVDEFHTHRVRFFRPSATGYVFSGSCSGVFVSSKGHLLTSRHCVDKEALSAEAQASLNENLEYQAQFKVFSSSTLYVILDQGSATLEEVVKPARVVSVGPESDLQKIISTEAQSWLKNIGSDGFSIPDPKVLLDEKLAHGFGAQSDWVVLKIEGIEKTSCLELAAEENISNDLRSMGFPGKKSEKGGAANTRLTIENGTIDKDQLCLSRTIQEKLEVSPGLEAQIKSFHFKLVPTTIRVIPGMSGGPVLNNKGHLVGTNTLGVPSCPLSYFNPISNIKSGIDRLSLIARTPPSSEIFNCRPNR